MPYLESKYTIELRYLYMDKNFKIFDFDYEFFDDTLKEVFEKKFIDYYFFNEIGCETIGRWKQMLRSRLNMKMPYYTQLYNAEIEASKCTFMLNKDLKETFTREIKRNEKYFNLMEGNNSSEYIQHSDNSSEFKESNLDNGLAELTDDMETSKNSSKGKSSNVSNNKSNDTSKNNSNRDNIETETNTIISQGNIGTTSSGSLLIDWRNSMINLIEIIIEDCKDLFMLIY